MSATAWENHLRTLDPRRQLIVPGDKEAYLDFCVSQWISIAKQAIATCGHFAVALSGGSTPKALFSRLAQDPYKDALDWGKVLIFWSDERSVPPEDPDSNYRMAMDAGFSQLPLNPENIFRMHAEEEAREEAAHRYEQVIRSKLPEGRFDLIMLGMGDDGHTASLFPHTEALGENERWVIENWVEQKKTWRMTFTYPCIHQARLVAVYVSGAGKAEMLKRVLKGTDEPLELPSQRLGTVENPVLWMADAEASSLLD